jgi:hypothetical protein
MRLVITEKQLRGIIKNTEVKEQEATTPTPEASSTPDSGLSGGSTSSSSSDSGATGGGTGYPSVTKWESGVTRGAANQIAVSKWSDVVGNAINRGKANPLT